MNTVSVDKKFLEHCLSVMRGVGELCQPIPRKSEDDPTEYCGGQALAELANCHNRLQETVAYAEQAEQPAEQEFHRVFEANESLEESLAEQPEAGRDEAVVDEADWTDRELKLIQFAVYLFMNDAYSQANYAAQRGTADQVRAFHADAKDAEVVLAKLRTLAPPVSTEAGRDEYHRCGKNIRRHKVSECRPQAQEAGQVEYLTLGSFEEDVSAEIERLVQSLDEIPRCKCGEGEVCIACTVVPAMSRETVENILAARDAANAEAVRVVSALRSLWKMEDGALVLCNASVSTIEAACREADTFLAQHGGQDDVR